MKERIALCKMWTKDGIRYTQDLMTGRVVGKSVVKATHAVEAPVVEQHSTVVDDDLDVPQFMKDWMREKAIAKRNQELKEQSLINKVRRMVR